MSELISFDKKCLPAFDLSYVEHLATRLEEVEIVIKECESRVSEFERTIAEYKQKREIEKHFHNLAGIPYEDKITELEKHFITLKSERNNAFSEKEKLRGKILAGLSLVSIPIGRVKLTKSEDEIIFPFRDGKHYPAIMGFIRNELKYGCSPAYIAFFPEGLKVFGISDELSAMMEVVSAIGNLKSTAKAKGQPSKKQETTVEEMKSKMEELPKEIWRIDFSAEGTAKDKTLKDKLVSVVKK